MTPRSKHIGIKYFWFRSQIGDDTGITITKCDIKDMLADIFTKGLPYDISAVLRTSLLGWTQAREGVSQDNTVSEGMLNHLADYLKNKLHIK